MRGAVEFRSDHPIGNLLGWWALAGVDTPVSDIGQAWLARAEPERTPPTQTIPRAIPSGGGEMPAHLPDFLAWLRTSPDIPEAAWAGPRIVPDAAAGREVMVITDMPDPEDMAAGALFSGESGQLFDRMLRAIGLDRSSIYLCSLACARPPGGMLESESGGRLARIMRHHVTLAAPGRLLLLGDKTSRALLTPDAGGGYGKLHTLNHEHGTIPAVATFHPRFLMRQPSAKAECWKDLQLFAKEVRS